MKETNQVDEVHNGSYYAWHVSFLFWNMKQSKIKRHKVCISSYVQLVRVANTVTFVCRKKEAYMYNRSTV